jgi:hypothetical protein
VPQNQFNVKRSRPDSIRLLLARMTRTLLLVLIFGMTAAGCADRYQREQVEKTLEAQNIAPQNYKPDIIAFLQTYLNNPEGVRDAAISEPQKMQVLDLERYAACLRYDTKNTAGRYTGLNNHLVVFVSGKFDRLIELGRVDRTPQNHSLLSSPPLQPLRDYCATATYQPFPELEKLKR